ncbi:hypothetical protein [uncultured Campylobacter sp.]|uniref:hypothetical protein n=1 Tax=uncultured Campylobacter sp. TaxID=218934 RepID=UPI0026356DD5|nr:hypothetical protein [uncultured Campylobacter sp.]
MNKIIFVAALGAGVYGVKKYLQSYTNRQRFFNILDDTVSFVKKSVKRGFEQDIGADFSCEIREVFYAFESMKSKSFEIFFELQTALAEIRNIKPNIFLLRMMPIKDDYLNFNTTDENLQLLREFTYLLSQANKLVNFTVINEIATLNDDFSSLNDTQMQFLSELINLNNLVVNAISCTTLTSNGEEINEQAKRAFQRLKIKLG